MQRYSAVKLTNFLDAVVRPVRACDWPKMARFWVTSDWANHSARNQLRDLNQGVKTRFLRTKNDRLRLWEIHFVMNWKVWFNSSCILRPDLNRIGFIMYTWERYICTMLVLSIVVPLKRAITSLTALPLSRWKFVEKKLISCGWDLVQNKVDLPCKVFDLSDL